MIQEETSQLHQRILQSIQVNTRTRRHPDVQPLLQEHSTHVKNPGAELSDIKALLKLEVEREEQAGQGQPHLMVRKYLPDARMRAFVEQIRY